MATESSTKKVVPKVVKLDKAFKLAEIWVKNMSGGTAVEKITDIETEARPLRLGLGARITPNAQRTPSTYRVERQLLGKVNATRKKSSENEDKMNSTERNEFENEDDTDEPESRTNAVSKKRPRPLPTAALLKRRK
ncbi:hypothetical protein FCM35_KLT20202 [Carex littledalei]|uniref:Uncharacterized protein n=1 Tax=Carex littledalei TaxID=544730 RepID=A0A833QZ72_9POAL|nr:hypothetical protein FCM35_KLT20202 [Carex littledalei]